MEEFLEKTTDLSVRSTSTDAEETQGPELLKQVVSLTRLPEQLIGNELESLLEAQGHSSENLTLDQLRDALLIYLESLKAEIDASEESGKNLNSH